MDKRNVGMSLSSPAFWILPSMYLGVSWSETFVKRHHAAWECNTALRELRASGDLDAVCFATGFAVTVTMLLLALKVFAGIWEGFGAKSSAAWWGCSETRRSPSTWRHLLNWGPLLPDGWIRSLLTHRANWGTPQSRHLPIPEKHTHTEWVPKGLGLWEQMLFGLLYITVTTFTCTSILLRIFQYSNYYRVT